MKSDSEYLLPILNQSLFINNWNQIRKLIHEKDNSLKLPELNKTGTCAGLSYAFIYYHQRGMGNEFFRFLEKVNNPLNINSISKDILNNKPGSQELIDFIYTVNVLHENQNKKHLSTVVDNIGSTTVDKGVAYVYKAKDITEQLNSLKPNDGMEMNFHPTGDGHSIAVYKTPQQTFIVYDSNNFKKHHCKSVNEAANKLFNSFNDTINPLELPLKDLPKQVFNYIASFLNIGNSLRSLPFPVPVQFNIMEKKTVNIPVAERKSTSNTNQILDRLNSLSSLSVEKQHSEKINLAFEMVNAGALDQLDKFLTETKLDLNKPLRSGRLPLGYLLQIQTNPKLVDLLVDHGAKANEDALVSAIVRERTEVAQRLLHWGANPNPNPSEYASPLFHAIGHNNLENVILLLDYGANPNIQRRDGVTPLQFAIEQGASLEIKAELLRAKADPFLKFNSKPNAFELAQNKGDVDFINLLSTKDSASKITDNLPSSSLPEDEEKQSLKI